MRLFLCWLFEILERVPLTGSEETWRSQVQPEMAENFDVMPRLPSPWRRCTPQSQLSVKIEAVE
jgi:hypothetical protein